MFSTIGKERRFSPPGRAEYDAMCAPDGAYLIEDPQTVATKILRINDDLGGHLAHLPPNDQRPARPREPLRGIELLGTVVAPIVRNAITN
jgi:hypothetical protein